ncbi:hypothetical protein D3C81_2137270 [compost metagenome]
MKTTSHVVVGGDRTNFSALSWTTCTFVRPRVLTLVRQTSAATRAASTSTTSTGFTSSTRCMVPKFRPRSATSVTSSGRSGFGGAR